jgi:hypothetical protein
MTIRTLLSLFLSLFSTIANAAPELTTNGGDKIDFPAAELKRCDGVQKMAVNKELNRVYNMAFPAYFEFCAGSTWHKRGATDGGNFGHAFGLIHGACLARDEKGKLASPQQLVPCEGGTIGFSTESVLFNQQWVGVEGREFMLFGEHDPSQPLDLNAWKNVSNEAFRRGIFSGIQLRPQTEKQLQIDAAAAKADPGKFRQDWIADYTFGTEFAIAATRGGVACTRVPLTSTKPGMKPLKVVLEKLNTMNRKAFADSKVIKPGKTEPIGYDYDGIVNNCVHTVYNALAEIDAWGKKEYEGYHPTSKLEILASADKSVAPFNQVLDTYIRGQEMKRAQIDNMIERFRHNQEEFKRFKENGWHPTQVGTMIDEIPALTYKNHIYDPTNQTNFLSLKVILTGQVLNLIKSLAGNIVDPNTLNFPLNQPLKEEFDRYVTNKSGPAMDLLANLELWISDYSATLTYLRGKQVDENDKILKEVISEITIYIEAKLKETSSLLVRARELTVNAPATTCVE